MLLALLFTLPCPFLLALVSGDIHLFLYIDDLSLPFACSSCPGLQAAADLAWRQRSCPISSERHACSYPHIPVLTLEFVPPPQQPQLPQQP